MHLQLHLGCNTARVACGSDTTLYLWKIGTGSATYMVSVHRALSSRAQEHT